jgi:tetratricopeptide (TPR) repeat protein
VRLTEGWKSELGKFEYIKKLGEGGFGEVWLASDSARKTKVAVKLLHLRHSDEANIEVFKREFEILAELKQVHLARVFDFGFSPENEQYFLSTEFCPGKKLLDAIQGQAVEYFEEILVQILSALECIHSQGVIHFDIKPDNVLVETTDGRPNVKLVDFGVAVRMKALPEQFGGTLAYVAPEVLDRNPAIDHRVDLYSLGMLSLLCLTGELPFVSASPKAMMDWHRNGKIPAKIWKTRSVPGYLRELTEKLLAKNPADRFSNSRVVLNFLNLATGGKYRQEEESLQAQIPIEGPIVQRGEEILQPIWKKLQAALSGRGAADDSSVLFVCGEPGIGKSRVLEEIRHRLQVKEIPFLEIDCDWNVAACPKLDRWLNLGPAENEIDPTWQNRRRIDSLIEAAEKNPLCLLIDDFHKGDQDLRNFVLDLVGRSRSIREAGQAPKLFVLAASGDPAEPGLKLNPLSLESILGYLRIVIGEGMPLGKLADVLHQYSGGLPLLMVEGLRYLAPHFFKGENLENILAPTKIHLLYEEKIQQLEAAQKELLLVLALLFRPATESELTDILGISASGLADLADACMKRGLMCGNRLGDSIYRVSSQALALDLIANLDPELRRPLHRKIAQGFARRPGSQRQELAYHLAKAGENGPALEHYQAAAERFEKDGKVASACDCLLKSLDLVEPSREEWNLLTLKVFRLLVQSGKYREAEEYRVKLGDFSSWERHETEGWYYFKTRKMAEARAKYLEALEQIPSAEIFRRLKIENSLGDVDLQEGKIADAVARFQKTSADESQLSEAEREKVPNNNLGLSLALLGRHAEAIAHFEKRLRELPPHKTTERIWLWNGLGYACLNASRYEDAMSHLKRALVLAEETGALHPLFSIMGNLLTTLLKKNRYVEALAILQKMDSYQKRFGSKRDVSHNLLRQGSVYLMLGMGEFAAECFRKGRKIAEELNEALLGAWFTLMEAYWEREFGDLLQAEAKCHETETAAKALNNEDLRAWARYGLAELAYDQGKLEDCRKHLAELPDTNPDQEFEIRLRLLRSKVGTVAKLPAETFGPLEAECLKNHYRELLWEVYESWAGACLKAKQRDEAVRIFEKGGQAIDAISSALPEEYRFRYLNQRARRHYFEDWQAAKLRQSSLLSRIREALKGGG